MKIIVSEDAYVQGHSYELYLYCTGISRDTDKHDRFSGFVPVFTKKTKFVTCLLAAHYPTF